MSAIQDKALAALAGHLTDLAESTGGQAIDLVASVAQGDGLAALETAVMANVDAVVASALGRLSSSSGVIGDAVDVLTSAAPLSSLEGSLKQVFLVLDGGGGAGVIADLRSAARDAIDNAFSSGSALTAVQDELLAAGLDAVDAMISPELGSGFTTFAGQVAAIMPRDASRVLTEATTGLSNALDAIQGGVSELEPLTAGVLRDGGGGAEGSDATAVVGDWLNLVDTLADAELADIIGPHLQALVDNLIDELGASQLTAAASSLTTFVLESVRSIDGSRLLEIAEDAASQLSRGDAAARLVAMYADISAKFSALAADLDTFEHEVVRVYNSIIDNEAVPAGTVAAAEQVAEAAGQLAFALATAGAAVTDLAPSTLLTLSQRIGDVYALLPVYEELVTPLDATLASLAPSSDVARTLESLEAITVVVHAAVRSVALLVDASDALLEDSDAALSDAIEGLVDARDDVEVALSEHLRRVEQRLEATRDRADIISTITWRVYAACGAVAAQIEKLTAAGRNAAADQKLLAAVHRLGSHAGATFHLLIEPAGGPAGNEPRVSAVVNATLWTLDAAMAAAEAFAAAVDLQMAASATPSVLSDMEDGGASIDALLAALRDLGTPLIPAAALGILADVGDAATAAAELEKLVTQTLPQLEAALAGSSSTSPLAVLRHAVRQVERVVQPFDDAAARQTAAVSNALADDSPLRSGLGKLLNIVTTVLAEGSTDDGSANYLVFPSDWAHLNEIARRGEQLIVGFEHFTMLLHPALADDVNVTALLEAGTALVELVRTVNASAHDQLCVTTLLNTYNESYFGSDPATGDVVLKWRMVDNTTVTCTAYEHLPTTLGAPLLQALHDVGLPRAVALLRRLDTAGALAYLQRGVRRLADVAAIVETIIALPGPVEDLVGAATALVSDTAGAVKRLFAGVVAGFGQLGPGVTPVLAGLAGSINSTALELTLLPAYPIGSDVHTEVVAAAEWSAALRVELDSLHKYPWKWSLQDWIDVVTVGIDAANAIVKVAKALDSSIAAAGAAPAEGSVEEEYIEVSTTMLKLLRQLGITGGASGTATAHSLRRANRIAGAVERWSGLFANVVSGLDIPAPTRRLVERGDYASSVQVRQDRRLLDFAKLKGKVMAYLLRVRDRVLTERFGCRLGGLAVLTVAVVEELDARGGPDNITNALLALADELQAAPAATLAALGYGAIDRLHAAATFVLAEIDKLGSDITKHLPAPMLTELKRKVEQLQTTLAEARHDDRLATLVALERVYQLGKALVDGATSVGDPPPGSTIFDTAPAVIRPIANEAGAALARDVAAFAVATKSSTVLQQQLQPKAAAAAATLSSVLGTMADAAAGSGALVAAAPTVSAVRRLRVALAWVAATNHTVAFNPDFTVAAGGLAPAPVLTSLQAVASAIGAVSKLRRLGLGGDDNATAILKDPVVAAAVDVLELTPLRGVDADFLQALADMCLAADLAAAVAVFVGLDLTGTVEEVIEAGLAAGDAALVDVTRAVTAHSPRLATLELQLRGNEVLGALNEAPQTPTVTLATSAVGALQMELEVVPPGPIEDLSHTSANTPRGKATRLRALARAAGTATAALTVADRAALGAVGSLGSADVDAYARAAALVCRQAGVRKFTIVAMHTLWSMRTLASVQSLAEETLAALPTGSVGAPAQPSDLVAALGPAARQVTELHVGAQVQHALHNFSGTALVVVAAEAVAALVTDLVAAHVPGGVAALPSRDAAWVTAFVSDLHGLRTEVSQTAATSSDLAAGAALGATKLRVTAAMLDAGGLLFPRLGANLTSSWQWTCFADALESALPDVTVLAALDAFEAALASLERLVVATEHIAGDMAETSAQPARAVIPHFVGIALPRVISNITAALAPPLAVPLPVLLARLAVVLNELAPFVYSLHAEHRLPGFADLAHPLMRLRSELKKTAGRDLSTQVGGASVDALASAWRDTLTVYSRIPTAALDVAAVHVVAVNFEELADLLYTGRPAVTSHGKLLSEEVVLDASLSTWLQVVPTAIVVDTAELQHIGRTMTAVLHAAGLVSSNTAYAWNSTFAARLSTALDRISPSILDSASEDAAVGTAWTAFLADIAPFMAETAAALVTASDGPNGVRSLAHVAVHALGVVAALEQPGFDASVGAHVLEVQVSLERMARAWAEVASSLTDLRAAIHAAPNATRVVRDAVSLLPTVTRFGSRLRRGTGALQTAAQVIVLGLDLASAIGDVAGAPSFATGATLLTEVMDKARALLAVARPNADDVLTAYNASAAVVLAGLDAELGSPSADRRLAALTSEDAALHDALVAARSVMPLEGLSGLSLDLVGQSKLNRLTRTLSAAKAATMAALGAASTAMSPTALLALSTALSASSYAVQFEQVTITVAEAAWGVVRGQELVEFGGALADALALSTPAEVLAAAAQVLQPLVEEVIANHTKEWRAGLAELTAANYGGSSDDGTSMSDFQRMQRACGSSARAGTDLGAAHACCATEIVALSNACAAVQGLVPQAFSPDQPAPLAVGSQAMRLVSAAVGAAIDLDAAVTASDADAAQQFAVADALLGAARPVPVVRYGDTVGLVWARALHVVRGAARLSDLATVLQSLQGNTLPYIVSTLSASVRPLLVTEAARLQDELRDETIGSTLACAQTVLADFASAGVSGNSAADDVEVALTALVPALVAAPSNTTLATWTATDVAGVATLVSTTATALQNADADGTAGPALHSLEPCYPALVQLVPQLALALSKTSTVSDLWTTVHALDAAGDVVQLANALQSLSGSRASVADLLGSVGTAIGSWASARHERQLLDVSAFVRASVYSLPRALGPAAAGATPRTIVSSADVPFDASLAARAVAAVEAALPVLEAAISAARADPAHVDTVKPAVQLVEALQSLEALWEDETSPAWTQGDGAGFVGATARFHWLRSRLTAELEAAASSELDEVSAHLSVYPVASNHVSLLLSRLGLSLCAFDMVSQLTHQVTALPDVSLADALTIGIPAAVATFQSLLACADITGIPAAESPLARASSALAAIRDEAASVAAGTSGDAQTALENLVTSATAAIGDIQQVLAARTTPLSLLRAVRDSLNSVGSALTSELVAAAEAALTAADLSAARAFVAGALDWAVPFVSNQALLLVERGVSVVEIAADLLRVALSLKGKSLTEVVTALVTLLEPHVVAVAERVKPRLEHELRASSSWAADGLVADVEQVVSQLVDDFGPEARTMQLRLRVLLDLLRVIPLPVVVTVPTVPLSDTLAPGTMGPLEAVALYMAIVQVITAPPLPAAALARLRDPAAVTRILGAFETLAVDRSEAGAVAAAADTELLLVIRVNTAANIAHSLADVADLVAGGVTGDEVQALAAVALDALLSLVADEIGDGAIDVVARLQTFLSGVFAAAPDLSGVQTRLDGVVDFANRVQSFRDKIVPKIDDFEAGLEAGVDAVLDFIAGNLQNGFDTALNNVRPRLGFIYDIMDKVDGLLGGADDLCQFGETILSEAERHVRSAREKLENAISDAVEAVRNMIQGGLDSFDALVNKGVEKVTEVSSNLIDKITAFIDKNIGTAMDALLVRVQVVSTGLCPFVWAEPTGL